MYEYITQSLVNTSQNFHFIHYFATSFNGQKPHSQSLSFTLADYIVGLTSNFFSCASQIH